MERNLEIAVLTDKMPTNLIRLAAIFLIAGCAGSSSKLKMEPNSVAKQLGVPNCRVSIPLSEEELLSDARRWGGPQPETRPEWVKIVAEKQAGDQLRMVDCIRSKHYFYYVHVRNGVVLTEMSVAILD